MKASHALKALFIALPVGLIVSAGAAFALSTTATVQDRDGVAAADEPAPTTRPKDDYPLDTCPVGGKLGSMGEPVVEEIDGRTVKFCCAACVDAFKKDAEKYHAKMDDMIIDAGREEYPTDVCLVSGEELDVMGGPMDYVHRETNTLVRFCCGTCEVAFKKSPEQYLKKLAAAKQAADEQP